MTAFFPDERTRPYNMVCYVRVTFSDGSTSRGSGAVVGPNDVLTAAHVISKGRGSSVRATGIDVFAGYDTGQYLVASSGYWRTDYYDIDITSTGSIYQDDSASDLAVIGLTTPIGRNVGYFGMKSYAPSDNYTLAGYPAIIGERQTADLGYAPYQSAGTYNIAGFYHYPGSSGGPLFDQDLHVVGVVSTTAWAARIDEEWNTIQSWISGNDYLMNGGAPRPTIPAPTLSDSLVYRFYNNNGTHFFTANATERDSIMRNLPQFSFEGNAFMAIKSNYPGAIPVYRFYRPASGTHFFTASTSERDNIQTNLASSYQFEGTSYYALASSVTGTTPLYRFYNLSSGTHFFTVSEDERNNVIQNLSGTYSYEGIAYYVSANTDTSPTRGADVSPDGSTRFETGQEGRTYLGGAAETAMQADGSFFSYGGWQRENDWQSATVDSAWDAADGSLAAALSGATLKAPYASSGLFGGQFGGDGAALTLPGAGSGLAADEAFSVGATFDPLAATRLAGASYTGMIFQA